MITVIGQSWALLLGMLFLMLGNGMLATLLGIRGAMEGYSASTMSFVMAGYFLGFLGGSMLAPALIRRVGHVRVFAALASMISATFILFAAFPSPVIWALLRIITGFCFSGVYVVAESWLNDSATNQTRGKTLSLYLVVQMFGVVTAQALLNIGDPSGYFLFVIASVLVSISFTPILLSVSPVPVFSTSKPMTLRELFRVSPLGCVGSFLLGGAFAGLWGMGSVYGTEAGMSVAEISLFIAIIYVGGLLCQFPIGWISDRMDRRLLIALISSACAVASFAGIVVGDVYVVLLIIAFLIGGITNPLYSLNIAYTNDFIGTEDRAAAAGGLIFIHGIGAIGGPVIVGWMMEFFGAKGFFMHHLVLVASLAGYAIYRMAIRPAPAAEDTAAFTPVNPASTPVAVDMVVQEFSAEQEDDR
ncbi:MAG: MFS transporter [Albidovulum sp.]|nr:MFS transporter [Albidovulum sp.]MDE0304145.1 MFS transporter [Albidovulum sp.]MDE0533459.1 MFS transporter [Albidovulum sp.]